MNNPSSNPKQTIIKILDIIDFSEDKDNFAAKFIEQIKLQSIIDMTNSLSENRKKELKAKISSDPNDAAKVSKILKAYFSDDLLSKSLEDTANSAIADWLKTLSGTLSNQQRENLSKFTKEGQPT